PIEFAALNFDFHPKAIWRDLRAAGFTVEKILTVSHFRVNALKRLIPLRILVGLDGLLQPTGRLWQVTPSVFVRAHSDAACQGAAGEVIFKCPLCHAAIPGMGYDLICDACGALWPYQDGIYDFRIKAD
ncbi:MAG TPA: hypothetical protein PLA02_06305, partial [Brevefilum fermentans]|nr:hypothetical protein [Brevefilum fermentans]